MKRKQVRAAKQTGIQDEFQNWKILKKLRNEKVLLYSSLWYEMLFSYEMYQIQTNDDQR